MSAQDPEPQEAGSGSAAGAENLDASEEEALAEDTSSEDVGKLTSDMAWHTDLKAARAEALAQKKLVFWVQILGQMDGKT